MPILGRGYLIQQPKPIPRRQITFFCICSTLVITVRAVQYIYTVPVYNSTHHPKNVLIPFFYDNLGYLALYYDRRMDQNVLFMHSQKCSGKFIFEKNTEVKFEQKKKRVASDL